MDALDANLRELTTPDCQEPLLFGGPASRLVNMLTCVILNGGVMAKALAERVSWEVSVHESAQGEDHLQYFQHNIKIFGSQTMIIQA